MRWYLSNRTVKYRTELHRYQAQIIWKEEKGREIVLTSYFDEEDEADMWLERLSLLLHGAELEVPPFPGSGVHFLRCDVQQPSL